MLPSRWQLVKEAKNSNEGDFCIRDNLSPCKDSNCKFIVRNLSQCVTFRKVLLCFPVIKAIDTVKRKFNTYVF